MLGSITVSSEPVISTTVWSAFVAGAIVNVAFDWLMTVSNALLVSMPPSLSVMIAEAT